MYFLFCKFTIFLGTAFTPTKMEGYTQFKMIRMSITFLLFKVQHIRIYGLCMILRRIISCFLTQHQAPGLAT